MGRKGALQGQIHLRVLSFRPPTHPRLPSPVLPLNVALACFIQAKVHIVVIRARLLSSVREWGSCCAPWSALSRVKTGADKAARQQDSLPLVALPVRPLQSRPSWRV